MDATRPRRIRDNARQVWYAHWRSVRFARRMGFPTAPASVLKSDAWLLRFAGWLPQHGSARSFVAEGTVDFSNDPMRSIPSRRATTSWEGSLAGITRHRGSHSKLSSEPDRDCCVNDTRQTCFTLSSP